MEFINNPRSTPGRSGPQPHGRPAGAAPRRPVMSEFAARPHAAPRPANPHPVQPAPQPTVTHHQPSHHNTPAHTATTKPQPAADPVLMPPIDLSERQEHAPKSKPTHEHEPKPAHETHHSGLVGVTVFIVLTAMALSPVLSGKILENFPGSSVSVSTGEQSIGCAGTLSPVNTTTSYDYKRGFPLAYGYATTSKISATCDGHAQTATGGHMSQFNPLGGLIDLAATTAIATISAKLWRKLRTPRKQR